MPRRADPFAAAPSFVKLAVVALALWQSACGRRVVQTYPTSNLVSVRGIVFDSLLRTPLIGARITFAGPDSATGTVKKVVTDTSGAFTISLMSGTWLMEVEHARFDSLRVSVPPRRVEVPPQASFALAAATPSPSTVTRALCGTDARDNDIALVGVVRNAATHTGLNSVIVSVKWLDLTLTAQGVARSTETRVTRTTSDGWYVSCDVPIEAELLAWAERDGATTGAVLLTSTRAPTRLDLTLDTTARSSTGPYRTRAPDCSVEIPRAPTQTVSSPSTRLPAARKRSRSCRSAINPIAAQSTLQLVETRQIPSFSRR